jgi:hypothetical protein
MRPMRSAILSRHSERLRGTQRAYHWVQWFALHATAARASRLDVEVALHSRRHVRVCLLCDAE